MKYEIIVPKDGGYIVRAPNDYSCDGPDANKVLLAATTFDEVVAYLRPKLEKTKSDGPSTYGIREAIAEIREAGGRLVSING